MEIPFSFSLITQSKTPHITTLSTEYKLNQLIHFIGFSFNEKKMFIKAVFFSFPSPEQIKKYFIAIKMELTRHALSVDDI